MQAEQITQITRKKHGGIKSHIRLRLFVCCLSAILTVSSWGILALSAVNNIMGGHGYLGLIIGIGMLVGGSMVLGLVNTSWLRALLIGIISPLCALVVSGVWSIILSSLYHLIPFVFISSSTTLAAVNFITLLGVTELLTRTPFKMQVLSVIRSMGVSFLVILIIEFGRITISNTSVVVDQIDWLIIIIYMLIIGINFAIIQEMHQLRTTYSLASIMIGLFFINIVALLISAAVTLLA